MLNREYSENLITKDDLLDINIQVLPKTIAIQGENKKFVYFIDT